MPLSLWWSGSQGISEMADWAERGVVSKGQQLVVSSSAAIRTHLATSEGRRRLRQRRLQLVSPLISEEDKHAWQDRITLRQEACGCELGGALAFVMLVCAATYFSLRESGWSLALIEVWQVTICLVSAALGGKALGLWIAKGRLLRVYRQLEQRLREMEGRPGKASFDCPSDYAAIARLSSPNS